MSEPGGPSAWSRAMAALADAGDRLVGEMAARGRETPPSEIHTSLLGALMDVYLNQIAVDVETPTFVPCTGYYQRLGSPNPDTVYRRAPIDPAAAYRLTGRRGTARDVTIMAFTAAMSGARLYDLSDVASGPDGRFDVLLSAARPDGHQGDWWEVTPDTASLWLREVSERWSGDTPSQIGIVRVDAPPYRRPSEAAFGAKLAQLPARVERIIGYGMKHVDEVVGEGFVNRLKSIDYSRSGAMPLQFYHEGLFRLGDGEALLIECRLPPDAKYFSWSLTDDMLVTLDWMNAASSLNSAQAAVDGDGVLRVVVAPVDPGTPNWLDTLGYRSGVMQFRTVGSPRQPEFTLAVVPLADVFARLPAGTPRVDAAARRHAVQQRQIDWQNRRLW